MMPTAAYLDGEKRDRLHLQHGPIDLVIGVDGGPDPVSAARWRDRAFAAAHSRFQSVLDELVTELPLLKTPVQAATPMPAGSIARRMRVAVAPFADRHLITPMAAVAGAVADEMLAAMLAAFSAAERPGRMHVNNGGDIALHLDPWQDYSVGIACEGGAALGRFCVTSTDATRGIATSGRGGRSLSRGIADSVTVLAANAAAADAAATIVGNGVDLPDHPAIHRAPANTVQDNSDLGTALVVASVGYLSPSEVARALAAGTALAQALADRHLLHRAALFLNGQSRIVGPASLSLSPIEPLELHHHA